MAAKKGNKYNEKWTEETVLEAVESILDLTENGIPVYDDDGETVIQREEVLWIGQPLAKIGLYRELWAYWKNKFDKETQVFKAIKKVETILETKLVLKGFSSRSPVMSIFLLKTNYGMREDIPGTVDNPISLNVKWLGNYADGDNNEEE
jgi:hypothetical protein